MSSGNPNVDHEVAELKYHLAKKKALDNAAMTVACGLVGFVGGIWLTFAIYGYAQLGWRGVGLATALVAIPTGAYVAWSGIQAAKDASK